MSVPNTPITNVSVSDNIAGGLIDSSVLSLANISSGRGPFEESAAMGSEDMESFG